MSSFNRRSLLFLPLALAACGFEPVYGPGGSAAVLRGRVLVDAPDDVDSYRLVRELESRLGRAQAPQYRLSIALVTANEGQGVTATGDITRYSIVGEAEYVLRRISDDEVVASGSVGNFTGYSATGSTVETLATERDARNRLLTILADQITAQLYSSPGLGA